MRGEPCTHLGRYAGRQVFPDGRGPQQEYLRPVFLDEISYHRSISLVLVVLQSGVIYDIRLARPVRQEVQAKC